MGVEGLNCAGKGSTCILLGLDRAHITKRVAALLAATLFFTLGCDQAKEAWPTPSASLGDVVATVDGAPIFVAEVAAHLVPASPRIGAAPPVDPRKQALERMLRVRLFAHEARRLRLPAPDGPPALTEAHLVQALIRRELLHHNVRADAISDEEARKYYDEHPELFNRPQAVHLSAIVVREALLAERLLQQAATAGEGEFGRLVERHSVDDLSRAQRGGLPVVVIGRKQAEIDESVSAAAYYMRKAGTVGLAQGSDGRYYVLRATKVEMTVRPWSREAALRVKNRMASDRQEQVLQALTMRLRERARIVVSESALERIRIPTVEEYLKGQR